MRERAVYALYDGDQFVTTGTASEIAEQTGLKKQTVQWYTSDASKRRKMHKTVIRLEEDEE